MMARQPKTWGELIASRVGYRKMARVFTFAMCWHITAEDLKRPPSMEEYGDWWGTSTATAYRDLRLFREALPMFADPGEWFSDVGRADLLTRAPARYLEGLD